MHWHVQINTKRKGCMTANQEVKPWYDQYGGSATSIDNVTLRALTRTVSKGTFFSIRASQTLTTNAAHACQYVYQMNSREHNRTQTKY